MKIQIERERLLKQLTQVSNVVERRQTLPILANVYIGLDDGMLTLTGTDLEIEVSDRIDSVKGTDGECTVMARKLLDICKALPANSEVTVDVDDNTATLRSGRSRFTLQTQPAKDYPRIEATNWEDRLVLKQNDLKNLLEKTSFSMAQQDVRYYLNGLLLDLKENRLIAVATDGHRLAKSEIMLDAEVDKERQMIVPRKSVLELGRFLDDSDETVTVEMNPNHIRVSKNGTVFTSKLIDGRFPDYEAVMSPKLTVGLMVDRNAFHDVLARTSILTNEKFKGVRLELNDNKMQMSANNPEQEEASDELPIEYDGKSIEIGFNVSYLMEALKSLQTDDIEFRMEDANTSCTVNAPGDKTTKYLVMPMRL